MNKKALHQVDGGAMGLPKIRLPRAAARTTLKKSPKSVPAKTASQKAKGKLPGQLKKSDATEWVVFNFHTHPGAKVYLAGTFNNWDPTAIKLHDTGQGAYTATVLLPLGKYEYKFVVNGDWRTGPDSREQVPNAFGTTNSVLIVSRTTARNGHLHTFSRSPISDGRPVYTNPIGR